MHKALFIIAIAAAGLNGQDRPVVAVVGDLPRVLEMKRQLVKRYTVVEVPVKGLPVFPPSGVAYREKDGG